MLPFLSKTRNTTTIIDNMSSDGTRESSHDEDMPHPELHAGAEELMSAIQAKDAVGMANALKRIHEHLSGGSSATDEESES